MPKLDYVRESDRTIKEHVLGAHEAEHGEDPQERADAETWLRQYLEIEGPRAESAEAKQEAKRAGSLSGHFSAPATNSVSLSNTGGCQQSRCGRCPSRWTPMRDHGMRLLRHHPLYLSPVAQQPKIGPFLWSARYAKLCHRGTTWHTCDHLRKYPEIALLCQRK